LTGGALIFITNLADAGTVLPAACAIPLVLLACGRRRSALAWLISAGISFATILGLKLSFWGCASPSLLAQVRSPSGHTASAAVVYGGLAPLLGGDTPVSLGWSLVVATVVGVSRVQLGMHSVAEVLVGGTIGIMGVALLKMLIGRAVAPAPASPKLLMLLPLSVIALAAAQQGAHWPVERLIALVARYYWPMHACHVGGS